MMRERVGAWIRTHKTGLVIAGILALGTLGFGTLTLGVLYLMGDVEVRGMAEERARDDRCVAAELGAPVEAGWITTGRVETVGSTGSADVSFPISGPRGSGWIYVTGTKSAGQWRIDTLSFESDTTGRRMDLNDPACGPPQVSATDHVLYPL